MTEKSQAKNQSSKRIIAWLFSHLLPYKFKVVLALIALLIGALAWLVLGQGVKLVVDQGFVAGDENMLTIALIIVLAIVLIGSLATYFRFYLMVWLGEKVCADIRASLFAHLVTLSPNFFAETRTGEVISRFTSDTTLLQSVVGTGVSMSLRSAVMLIGALVLMLITSWQLTLYVFIAVPLILLPIKALGKQVRFYAKQSQDDVASMGTLIDESLHEIHTLQSYNHEQASVNNFNSSIDKVMASASQRIHYRALLIALIMFISLSSIFIVGWIGAREVIAGNISAGELTAFVFYAVLAGGSIATISEVIGDLQKAVGASERIVELLNTAPEITNSQAAKDKSHLDKHPQFNESAAIIEAKEITFAYPSAPDKEVIKNVSFNAQRGQKIAIVGHSGAGKSTLFDLLMRFYELNQGDIKIAGIPQKALSIEDLRKQFALVPQDAVIFALSVSDNIRLSKPNATDDEIVAAAKLAYADEFIQGFSQGYQTELGERGVKLSGGQKQRIAIARAILAKRPILLLDEATSALDASSERYVKLALDSLMQETTTLIIAHRLSTVLNADKILVMQQGELIAQGTHDTLLMSNTVYKEFVELQLS
ncbi:ABC transporter transmembrane domain-containing protein [Glaciecola sp. KUL10]|uniref:ABC transporter transmembrane domain-containing protein n=1 Tax=Glaciecola sp. (strain KUL10) TaxID=2161813 RepID=UPI000D785D9D|nr:ABC transporter transmembrane domain-containing protein [Glaciecola sp. KUL10]GBL04220.1 lipid ABC transporter ATPase/inner membrane protein [Glaciecola sp. KUL10]